MATNPLKSHFCPHVQIENFFTYVVFSGFCLLEKGILFSIDFFFYEASPRNSTSGRIFKAAQDQLLLVLAVL